MSADTTPITPERFAAAIVDLNQSTLYLKVLEIRNSIAHLLSSNAQLEPFARGDPPDDVCADAIRENEEVIARMHERIALIRAEVENRGMTWDEFDRAPSLVEAADQEAPAQNGVAGPPIQNGVNSHCDTEPHAAWSDGTFQVGRISGGQVHMDSADMSNSVASAMGPTNSGPLENAQELERQLQQRLADLDDDNDDGLHL
ncbi:hypothetical protein TD95_002006 [Thielaviopsis punctulata]|uniref:Uncharacterized protein n=1 Tax=Thielaviopsis punctulata TaxID=72032 RepID=A0A0F4ZHQ6_9PEZI|nr:hypothetical protein TD95_002006 [Thielaviopsis punctulata]